MAESSIHWKFSGYLTLNNIVTVKSGLEVTQDHSNWYCLRNIWSPTSLNWLSLACRGCDYYTDYVRCSRSSSYRLLRPINCQFYIRPTLHYITLPLGSLGAVSYSPSIVTMALYCIISEIKRYIGGKSWSDYFHTLLHSTPPMGGVEVFHAVWYGKLELSGYSMLKNVDGMFSRFDRLKDILPQHSPRCAYLLILLTYYSTYSL